LFLRIVFEGVFYEEILHRRYAGGEMSREEYLEAKTTLKV